eukprot:gene3985-10403_t
MAHLDEPPPRRYLRDFPCEHHPWDFSWVPEMVRVPHPSCGEAPTCAERVRRPTRDLERAILHFTAGLPVWLHELPAPLSDLGEMRGTVQAVGICPCPP